MTTMFATEFLDLPPLQSVCGTVRLPGSKSISNRVLLLAALSQGVTEVHDLLDSDDTRVMLDALQQLGCKLEQEGSVLHITGLACTAQQRGERARIFSHQRARIRG